VFRLRLRPIHVILTTLFRSTWNPEDSGLRRLLLFQNVSEL
jgi:hypothetical protein